MIFRTFFLLFMASVQSRPPGPPAVPGVFTLCFYFLKLYDTLNSNYIMFSLTEKIQLANTKTSHSSVALVAPIVLMQWLPLLKFAARWLWGFPELRFLEVLQSTVLKTLYFWMNIVNCLRFFFKRNLSINAVYFFKSENW